MVNEIQAQENSDSGITGKKYIYQLCILLTVIYKPKTITHENLQDFTSRHICF
jgi:hypothetical protein